MAFGGDVDTLNLLFDKLQYIFSGYTAIRDSFVGVFDLYKKGKIYDIEFFEKLNESISRFSALEFLSIKAIFEIKKTMNRSEMKVNKNTVSTSDLNMPSGHSITSFITPGILPQAKSFVEKPPEANVCPKCGVPTKKTSSFCTNCGSNLQ